MSSRQVLTLKYRPRTFAELLIQDHVKNTLIRAIENNRLANAYLFAGPRGVGKTTTARILAKSLNCLSYRQPTVTPCNQCSACVEIAESRSMDVLEIDGASNRGIDQVRELRENIKYAPASFRYKVYIIDEVHMLTKEAFNALLKTLEEPPAHAKFIFATTAPHEVPTTILSRCQRFDFRKATVSEIIDRLKWLAEQERIKISEPALAAVARRADGAIRDAEGLLDMLATYSPEGIELVHVEELLGLVPADLFYQYADLLSTRDPKAMLDFTEQLFTAGYDLVEFFTGTVNHFRNLLLLKLGGTLAEGFLPEEINRLQQQAEKFDLARIVNIINTLSMSEKQARESLLPKILLEIVSLKLLELGSAGNPAPTSSTSDPPAGKKVKSNRSADLAPPVEKPAPQPESAGDPPPSAPPVGNKPLDQLWTAMLESIAQQRPGLFPILQFAKPLNWDGRKLTIGLYLEHRGNIHLLKSSRALIETTLSTLTGSPAVIETTLIHEQLPPDWVNRKVRELFGDAEEEP
ncbi:MAG: DNA polymerase III subunit gamma/tau [candidate division WOR-3 bacterium]